jgi:hypothetical protein
MMSKPMSLLRGKHCLNRATTVEHGVTLRAGVWSADEDKHAVSGVGIIEVEIRNLRVYPVQSSVTVEATVEAKGEDVRWETQPSTNRRMLVIDSDEIIKFSQPFEVEANVFQEHRIWVLVSLWRVHDSTQQELSVSLPFNTSAISRLLFRINQFEEVCSTIAPDFEIANLELIEYCAKHPEHIHELHWRRGEELLASIFKNLGYRVELGPGQKDGGVDLRIFLRDDIGELLTLVQMKRYAPKRPIALEPVAALSAIVDQQNAHRGLFVTTSRYLPVAKRFAEKQGHRLVLANSSDMAKWCKEVTARLSGKRHD